MELLHDMLDQIERQRLTKMVNEIPDHDVIDSRSVARALTKLIFMSIPKKHWISSVRINYIFIMYYITSKYNNSSVE